MPSRTSIYLDGFAHKNPVPAACRIGNIVHSGSILGVDPATGRVADTVAEQCAFMFGLMQRIVEAAGATIDDVIKVTVWMTDLAQREAVNKEWVALFPDPANRPARHAIQAALPGGQLVKCEFVAVLGDAA